jgi:transposase
MPRRLVVAPHLALDELEQHYRTCRHVVERTHWHMVWLVAQGRAATEVAGLVGSHPNRVREIVHRYNTEGPESLRDRRHDNRGRSPLLDAAHRERLRAALAGPAPDGGLWTGRKVAAWMADHLGRPVAVQRGWEAMVALGFSPQRPRPRATTADPEAQAAFKRGGSSAPSIP